jgi:predicted metal-binding membrane protein
MTPAALERSRVRVPIVLASAAGWTAIASSSADTALHAQCATVPDDVSATIAAGILLPYAQPGAFAATWCLMTVAMMLPLMTSPISHVRDRSFRHRRSRAIGLFLAGYGAVWMLAGFVLLPLARAVRMASADSFVPATVFGLTVVLWQASPMKQTCLNRGHGHPELVAFGWAADVDVLRFGGSHGVWCVGSCWALMLVPILLSRGHVVAMAAVSLWFLAERLERPTPPRWELRGPVKGVRIAIARLIDLHDRYRWSRAS